MGIGIFLIDEVRVVCTDEFDVQFLGKLYQCVIDEALSLVGLVIGSCYGRLVALQFQVVIVTKHALEPLDGLTCLGHLAAHDELRHLASQTGRAADDTLVVLLQFAMVGSGMIVHALGPGVGDDFDEVLVALQVLGQQNQVVAVISLVTAVMAVLPGYIHLAAEDRLEQFFALLGALTVEFADIVMELFDAIHVAVVGNRHATHAVGHCLVDQGTHGRHAIKNRVL